MQPSHTLLFSALLSRSPVSAHSQERPTAAVTPIQVQSAAGLPHHPLASPQPPGPMGPPAHVAAGSLGRVGAPLACAAAPPSLPAASLETEPGGRPVTVLPGPPTSPDSSSAAKPDKDSKVTTPRACQATGARLSAVRPWCGGLGSASGGFHPTPSLTLTPPV